MEAQRKITGVHIDVQNSFSRKKNDDFIAKGSASSLHMHCTCTDSASTLTKNLSGRTVLSENVALF